ncbi:MAG: hypothetical protein EOO09_10500 [Chitinophagaceae bacterium]|nr:MAG: hypothetical protein EOO09_10500 [Chitinophagaceae bacterium]
MRQVLLFCSLFFACCAVAQEIPVTAERQLEKQAIMEGADPEDDLLVQQLEMYSRHKMDINNEAGEVLLQLGIVSVQQAKTLDDYRRLFGDLIHLYELQAVPGWDLALVRRISPYVEIKTKLPAVKSLASRWKGGEHSIILRFARALSTGEEYRKDEQGIKKYQGDPMRVFFRHRYLFRDKLQYGITAEKDAGEQFRLSKGGFDFYSAHLFIRDIGKVRALALGDFTVNMGQGLVHWQSMAFKKSADAMNIKRQSQVLRPYNSAGEANFFRGIGVSVRTGHWDYTAFASVRRISTNQEAGPGGTVFSSFLRSGYNRTLAELEVRNNTRQSTGGMVVSYKQAGFRVGANFIFYHFSVPQLKSPEPYNQFAFTGNRWVNGSVDLMYTWKNLHWFGELATDLRQHPAGLAGLVAGLGRAADFSLLYRRFDRAYQTVSGNAFSESTAPSNEEGLYAGLSFRPSSSWKMDLYFDLYHFPWLRYRVSAPAAGRDWMIQLAYIPNRQVEITTRVRSNTGERNAGAAEPGIMEFPLPVSNFNWRIQSLFRITKSLTLRNRTEMVMTGSARGKGFLASADFTCKPMQKPFDISLRGQYFTTDNYDSRLYAYENDVLYAQSVPVFSGTGLRYYLLLRWDPLPGLSCWLRYSATKNFGSPDPVPDEDHSLVPIRRELKIQARFLF